MVEKSQTEQYTFSSDEKETLKKLNIVEASVERQNIQEKNQRELIATKYYSEFVINTEKGPITLKNVFITEEKDHQGNTSYHFHWINENGNGEQIIEEYLSIDSDGKVRATGDLAEYLGEELDIEECINKNDIEKDRLKGISEKNKDLKEKSSKDEDTNEIDEDLKSQGQDLGLTNIRQIKDVQNIKERMPDVFDDSEEHAQAYSQKLGKYVMLEKISNGDKSQWQINENIQPAKTTLRTIISIDEDGSKIEKQVPYALMKTNRSDKEIAVTYGDYGTVNIQTVDVLPCQERIARQVREQGEDLSGQEENYVRNEFRAGGKEYSHDLVHGINEIEDIKEEFNQEPEDEISEDDYIPNTDTKWKDLMEETGDSLPALIERYNKDMINKNGQEDSQQIVDNIIDDYQMVSHEHKH